MNNKFPFKIVDLTHTLNSKIPSWDQDCGFSHKTTLDYEDCQTDVKFHVQHINMQAGIGTHIDAPAHCINNGKTVENFSLDELISPCICINVSSKAQSTFKVSIKDILEFEKKHGKIQKSSFVIIYTGWSKYWGDPKMYHNNYNFPSVSAEVAKLLLERDIVGLGIGTLSPDIPDSGYIVHQLILEEGKYLIENIANADSLPA
ncbi:MAG: cyclase family protein, partial [Legionellales bacterium]|nr:cyclase family protein [Legionellales bacterium]